MMLTCDVEFRRIVEAPDGFRSWDHSNVYAELPNHESMKFIKKCYPAEPIDCPQGHTCSGGEIHSKPRCDTSYELTVVLKEFNTTAMLVS